MSGVKRQPKLITLQVSSDSNTVTRVGDSGSQAGEVSGVPRSFANTECSRPYGRATGIFC